ncbi:Transporter aclS [Fulvia fulva]|uniref:Transporter aclS n=1 Tax=Passalora fulva TaxID=5499 RepID=A0A9Q8LF86_PASFU|nr:Transporter aclS [Fulvia fulva]KAK4628683.1 Transporter aclS [Fulvia fulva]UJO16302.1 Transporter aclS [Fulvia fulva]WPV29238.1 Transporter aclS [Fulvia fulva]
MTLSNFQLGASLVSAGLAVWQAIIAIILGKFIIAAVAVTNGYLGAEWHIGFPVVSRYVWGIYGHYVALVQRVILSLVWFAVQSWTGGLGVQNILAAIFPSYQNMGNVFPASANMNAKQFIGWVLFNVLIIPLLYIRPEKLQWVVLGMNIVTAITLLSIVIWVLSAAGGGGPLLTQPAETTTSSELGWAIVHGVTTVIGGIAVGLTNQMDYSRFARRPGDQVFGQWFSIIVFGAIMPSLGCFSASASQEVYGEAIWNPPDLVQKWLDTDYNPKSRSAAFFAGCGLLICQLAINTVDNAFSAGMDMAGLAPSFINIRRGAYIGLVLSIAMCPWQLLSAASTFVSVLSAYSVFLGPMVGIMVCDYWTLRHRIIKLSDLYHPGQDGLYYFWHGINWRAFIAWAVGWSYLLPGFAHAVTPRVIVPEACTNLYYLAFPLGFTVSFTVYWCLNKVWTLDGFGVKDEIDYYGTFTEEEAAKLGVAMMETIEGEVRDGVSVEEEMGKDEKFVAGSMNVTAV